MANAWTQVSAIASEALIGLEDNLIIGRLASRDKTAEFNKTANGYSKGESVSIKTGPEFKAVEFDGEVEVQGIRSSKRQLTIESHLDVSVEITAKEKALDFEGFNEDVVIPAAKELAEKVDTYVGQKILDASTMYASDDLFGTSGDMALARERANYQQLSARGRYCILSPAKEAQLLGKDWFNSHNNRGQSAEVILNSGNLGNTLGMDFFSSYQFPSLTFNAGNGITTTDNSNGADNLVGLSVLTVDPLTGTINAGDRVDVAGLRRSLRVAVQANAGATSIALIDPITQIIPDGAAVTVTASGESNIDVEGAIFDGQSLAMAMPILDLPDDKSGFVANANGISIRVVVGYEMKTKKTMMSLDTLVGAAAYDPRKITLLGQY